MSKISRFRQLSNVNKQGFGQSVGVHQFTGAYEDLRFSNGGSWSRFDGALGRQYRLVTYKPNGIIRCSWTVDEGDKNHLRDIFQGYVEQHHLPTSGNQILLLKLHGLQNLESGRPIAQRVREHFRDQACVVCGTRSQIEIDHKNGLYNDPRVLNVTTQQPSDFQPLCKHCNDVKREAIKKMRESGQRPSALEIPSLAPLGIAYTQGDSSFNLEDPNWALGTYWYDPVAFIQAVRKQMG